MIKKELTIAGKQVTLAYCYATEIAYKEITGEEIVTIFQEIAQSFNEKKKDPDMKRSIMLIAAAIMAYDQSKGPDEEPQMKVNELMCNISPTEWILALTTILTMRAEFYGIPLGEPEDKPAKGGKKKKN